MARLRAAVEEACAQDPFHVMPDEPVSEGTPAEGFAAQETAVDMGSAVTFVAVNDGPRRGAGSTRKSPTLNWSTCESRPPSVAACGIGGCRTRKPWESSPTSPLRDQG